MKAVILKGGGDISQLVVEEIEKPIPAPNEILLKVKAFSINPIEVKTRKGNVFTDKLLADKPSIPGWDASGIVEETGNEVSEFKKEDRVFGVIGFPYFGKTYAEYLVCKPQDVCLIPENIDFNSAASATIAAYTAYQALNYDADLKPGQKILIHAASGGVGHFAVQIAKYLGTEVYATASAGKHEFLKSLGVDHVIDYKTQNFEEILSGMDVVFDLIGGDYIDKSIKTLKPGGIIISIPSSDNQKVVEKATAAGMKGVRFIMNSNQKDLKAIADLMAQKILKPFISKIYPMDEIREAHRELEAGHVKGKIVVNP